MSRPSKEEESRSMSTKRRRTSRSRTRKRRRTSRSRTRKRRRRQERRKSREKRREEIRKCSPTSPAESECEVGLRSHPERLTAYQLEEKRKEDAKAQVQAEEDAKAALDAGGLQDGEAHKKTGGGKETEGRRRGSNEIPKKKGG